MNKKWVIGIIVMIFLLAALLALPERGSFTYPIFYSDPVPFVEGLYFADQNITPVSHYPIKALVVPHHLAASRSIAVGIRMTKNQSVRRIVMLMPDHFKACSSITCTISGTVKTLFGDVRLEAFNGAENNPSLFKKEHALHAVLPFIAHDLPGVSVISIAFNQHPGWEKQMDEILPAINRLLDDNTLLIVSSDFSHYLSVDEADKMDEKTAQAILSKDFKGIQKLNNPAQSDCPFCLSLLARTADAKGFYNPSILLHTNSARLLQEDIPETTSHFAMAFYQNAELTSDTAAFAGDITVTRDFECQHPSDLKNFWSGNGLRVVNLEGPVKEDCPQNSHPLIFCNPKERLSNILKLATHWDIFNNHMSDLGQSGIDNTLQILSDLGETPIWDVYEDNAMRIYAFSSVLNPVSSLDLGARHKWILEELKRLNYNKLVVVLVHYGKEYSVLTSEADDALLKSFIDAGADAVIGHHSHVPGDVLIYKERPIFRGLGNFYFDQFADFATRATKIVRLKRAENAVEFESWTGEGCY